MKAILIDKMGSDLTVVNAARVSFAKESKKFSEQDGKLISYLARNNHWTPFGHCQAQFHMKAPIFLARQMVKHQVGLVWNEVSRRYVDDTPEFWWPTEWRLRAENKKQGSSEETIPVDDDELGSFEGLCVNAYNVLLARGVAPEMARIVLPVNMYTEWYWTGSLAAWARVCKLRLDPHAQKEAQIIAQQISDQMAEAFPHSWNALVGVAA